MITPLKWSDFIESGNYGTCIRTSIPLNLTLDGGFLTTYDLYQIPQDYKYVIVHQLMVGVYIGVFEADFYLV